MIARHLSNDCQVHQTHNLGKGLGNEFTLWQCWNDEFTYWRNSLFRRLTKIEQFTVIIIFRGTKHSEKHYLEINLNMDSLKNARGNIAEGIELLNERNKTHLNCRFKTSRLESRCWIRKQPYRRRLGGRKEDHESSLSRRENVKNSRKPLGRGRPHPCDRRDPSPRAADGGPYLRRPWKCFDCGAEWHWALGCRRKDTER